MQINKPLNRLLFRFKSSFKNDDGTRRQNIKPFYPNKQDVDAINAIVKWVNQQKMESINQNRIFAKLFLKRMTFEVWKTSSYDLALQYIRDDLRLSLESHYKTFQSEMMMYNFDLACQAIGVPDPLNYEKGVSVAERKAHSKAVLKAIKDNEVELKKEIISNHWNEENTRIRLNDLISDLINEYGRND